jgi:transposase
VCVVCVSCGEFGGAAAPPTLIAPGSTFGVQATDQDIEDISEALDDPAVAERLKFKLLAVRLHCGGAAHAFIAKSLRLSPNTLTNYLKAFQQGGLAALLEDRYYRPSSSLAPFWPCLRCSFAVAPVANAKLAVARIEALTGVRLSESQARRTMKRMGMKLRQAAPIPGKADKQLQFTFYQQEMIPRLQEAAQGKRKVFFLDAAHFVLGAFLGMIWCFSRVFVKTSPGRQRYNVLGAVDSHSKQLISIRTTENITAEIVQQLLDLIRTAYPEVAITLVLDNARYQHCVAVKAKAAALDIELLFLPAYSPNLNLIERVWKLVKKRCLTNKYYGCFARFRNAIDNCLDDLNGPSLPELHSLLTLNFQFFGFPNS